MLEKGEYDPVKAQRVEDRLDLINRLKKKYGDSIKSILAAQEQLQNEYDHFASMDKQVAVMAAEHKKLLQVYRQLARQLTESRQGLAATFEEKMSGQLCDLGMAKTVFKVEFAPKP